MVEDSRIEIDPPGGPNEPPPREPPVIMIRQGSGKWFALGCLLSIVLIITVFVVGVGSITRSIFGSGPDPETIASASLEGLREQNVLIPFEARFVAVITSTQRRFGLSARKTLIMPGNVRYELDLGALGDDDVDWDASTNTLTVTMPDLTISDPDIDIDGLREYDSGGILIAVTDAEEALDAANRAEGQRSLMRQARAAPTMRLAQDAARRAVENNFELPLRAAGIDATVRAQFRNEVNPNQMDRSRDVLGERREGEN
ncbi:DUF4230 domain-containing protein [Parasphingopyxis sp.]|uniref:DUF4230 domain-containing protein n=1 Tax=Parasphingopyxis sp. TaxID=1920299 RepID=UPI002632D69C|nr:DUF4230 domain-containing protein [Parasphingopyxis sp.]